MAYPYVFNSNFDQAYAASTNADWSGGSDTGSLLDFPHYSLLAADRYGVMPYQGAYCMRNQLGDTNDHTVIEGAIDIADAGTAYFRWYMALSGDFGATADDTFNIFELQQAGGTVESSVGMRVTASSGLIEIGIGDGTAPTSFVNWPAGLRKWVCVELLATISTGGAGVLTLFLDGTQVATLTGLTNAAAVGQGALGSQNTLATTLGTIYFDLFTQDTARLYPLRERFPQSVDVIKTRHIFVGPGCIEGAAISKLGANDETLTLYDTDTATTYDIAPTVNLRYNAQTSVAGPIYFKRGCYAVVAGTAPRNMIYLMQNTDKRGARGPLYYSSWGMRYYGNLRKQRTLNV